MKKTKADNDDANPDARLSRARPAAADPLAPVSLRGDARPSGRECDRFGRRRPGELKEAGPVPVAGDHEAGRRGLHDGADDARWRTDTVATEGRARPVVVWRDSHARGGGPARPGRRPSPPVAPPRP